jgi:hypothetical protein
MPTLSRTIVLRDQGGFEIVDRFHGEGAHRLSSPFHFAPGVQLTDEGVQTFGERKQWIWIASAHAGKIQIVFDVPRSLEIAVEKSTWWPRFYVEEPIQRLAVTGSIEGTEQVVVLLIPTV